MTIAIASDDGTHVTQHFGRTLGFVMYSKEETGEEQRYVRNTVTGHAHGHGHSSGHDHAAGHHHSHAGILAGLAGCDVVVSGGMGRRLREDLRQQGIEAIVTAHQRVEDVIIEARQGMLVHQEGRSCGH